MKSKFIAMMWIAGIAFGLYAGFWWAFIGGIVDIVREVRAQELDAMALSIGIAKMLLAGPIGYLAAMSIILPTSYLADK